MKNFFKKLAFVLALAMVVTAIAPAAKASAAAQPTLNVTSKKIYIDGDYTGKYSDTFTLKVWNKGDYRVTFASSDTKIATVTKWYGVVTAKAVGTATITATVSNKTTGKVIKTLSAKVYVKKNADSVAFGSLAKFDQPLSIGDKVKINVARKAGSVTAWKQADKTQISDYIVWESSNPSVATVDKWGTVKAIGGGETTITAVAMQTEGPVATTAAASVKVTVKAGIVSASQKNVTTANVVLGTAVTDKEFNKDTVKVYSLVGNTKVLQTVKNVAIDSADATKATVEMFVGFAKDAVYSIEYNDTTFEIIGADTSADAVDSIKITTTEAVNGVATEIKYQLLTANGVDITSAVDKGRVSFTTTSNDAYIDSASNSITFFELGKVAEVKGVFHTYKYDTNTGAELSKNTTVAITSVEAAKYALGTVTAWSFEADGAIDFDKDKLNQKLSLSESVAGTTFVARFVKNDSSKTKVVTTNDPLFTYESSNNNVLVVAGYKVYPVSQGTATIIIKYDNKVVDAVNVTVLPKRVVATITVNQDKTALSNAIAEKSTVKFEVKDQFETKFNDNKVTVTLLSGPSANAKYNNLSIGSIIGTDVTKVELFGNNFNEKGYYQFKVTAGDQVRVFGITVNTPSTTTAAQKLDLSTTEVDTALKLGANNDTKNVSIELYNVDASGIKQNKVTLFYGKDDAVTQAGNSGKAYYYVITNTSDSKDLATDSVNVDKTNNKFVPISVSNGAISKVKDTSYKVAAYEVTTKADGSVNAVKLVDVKFITVKDSQSKATVVQNKTVSTATTVTGAIANKDFTIKLDINNDGSADDISTAVSKGEIIGVDGAGYSVFVKNVKYTAGLTYNGQSVTYEITIDVNKNLQLAK